MRLTHKQDLELRHQLAELDNIVGQVNLIDHWSSQGIISTRKSNDFRFMVTLWHNEKFKKPAQ